MGSRSIGRMLLVILMGSFLSCNLFTVAASQGIQQFPQSFAGVVPGGVPGGGSNLVPPLPGPAPGPWWRAIYNNPWNFLGRITVTNLRLGLFYGLGQIHVDDSVAFGQTKGLLQSDFAGFDHHRTTDLRDGYFSGVFGMGSREREFFTFGFETNFRSLTKFQQDTDAGNFPVATLPPIRWYRGALGVLVLGNGESGELTLNNRNRYWAFDLCGRLPIFPAWDLLIGYKWSWINSNIDPLSASTPPGAGGQGFATYPVFPGQQGWRPAWRDGALASTTEFGMAQSIKWNGPFIGVRLSNNIGYGSEWSLDTRLYPWLFGEYTFSWNGAYIDPTIFVPGIFGAQSTSFTGNRRFAIDVDFRCRSSWRNSLTLEFETRYSYASMSGSCVEYQTLGNIYFGALGNYSQDTPETLSITQQLWTIGGNLEYGF
jgi:hypothetical protein